jgi:hypothetical protein
LMLKLAHCMYRRRSRSVFLGFKGTLQEKFL